MAAKKVKVTKTVLITGAASGIGFELAKVFADHRYHLIMVDPSKQQLQKAVSEINKKHKIKILSLVQDLNQPDAAQNIYDRTKKEKQQVEILVNNAGVGISGKFIDTDIQDELKVIQVNIITLTSLTKLFAKEMAERGFGKILNVASTAAFFPGPLMAVYYATNAYALSFSQALSEELSNKGITVSTLCPGPADSDSVKNSHVHTPRLFKTGTIPPRKIAESGFNGLMKRNPIIIPGGGNQAMVFLSRFVPRNFQAKVIKYSNQTS